MKYLNKYENNCDISTPPQCTFNTQCFKKPLSLLLNLKVLIKVDFKFTDR